MVLTALICVSYSGTPLAEWRGGTWMEARVRSDDSGVKVQAAGLGFLGKQYTVNGFCSAVPRFEPELDGAPILVSGGMMKAPAKFQAVDPIKAAVKSCLYRFFEQYHFHAEPIASKAWLCNVDGKGDEELIVLAQSRDDLGVTPYKAGDYSVLLVRQTNGSRSVIKAIKSNLYFTDAKNEQELGKDIELLALADFNGDGVCEWVIQDSNFTGYRVTLGNWTGSKWRPYQSVSEGE